MNFLDRLAALPPIDSIRRRRFERQFASHVEGGFGGNLYRGVYPTFEAAQRELEDIVERLELGNATLDEAIALWQRGEDLYRFCRSKLDTAEGRIEELAKRVEAAAPEAG